jgi:protein ImuB
MIASSGADVVTASLPVAPESRDASSPDASARDDDYAALRLLESPEVVAVECRPAGDEGAPAAMQWRGRRVAFARADGPERLSGEWWKEGFRRDYWRCESEGSEFLLFRERPAAASAPDAAARWCLQGWYD